MKTSCSIKLKAQARPRSSCEWMPVFANGTTFDVHAVGAKGGGERNVKAEITNGMSLSHITVRPNGALSRSDNVDSWKRLVPIHNPLRLPFSQLVTIRVENIFGQCLRMQKWNDVGGYKRIKTPMEGSSLSSVLKWCHEATLIL